MRGAMMIGKYFRGRCMRGGREDGSLVDGKIRTSHGCVPLSLKPELATSGRECVNNVRR